jgi:chromosome segregation and condensation protein ScpB
MARPTRSIKELADALREAYDERDAELEGASEKRRARYEAEQEQIAAALSKLRPNDRPPNHW